MKLYPDYDFYLTSKGDVPEGFEKIPFVWDGETVWVRKSAA